MSVPVHVRKFMGGRMTPTEAHRKYGWRGRKCEGCSGPPAIQIRVFVSMADAVKLSPEFVVALRSSNPAGFNAPLPVVPTTYGPMLKVSDCVFCDLCKVSAEKAAARGPSCALVEISRGPDPRNAVAVQVPHALGLRLKA